MYKWQFQSFLGASSYFNCLICYYICVFCERLNLYMKKIAAFVLIILLTGCKKATQQVQEDLVIKAMTDGKWKVTSFTLNGSNITADFTLYRFKYYSNKTVDAINNGTVEKTGSWDGDAANMSTWAQFTGVANPLALINGSWHIDRNSWTFVEASQTIPGGDTKTMRLDKE
jgi:hypothetical protein